MNNKVLSVSDLLSRIKNTLDENFGLVIVAGEITNFSNSASGHYYFSISDDKSLLNVVMFKMDVMRNTLIKKLDNGDKVECMGEIGLYRARGIFQLIAKRIRKLGTGDLKEQFEATKSKLASEGLLDIYKKREIPSFCKNIAIITAEKGAALQDFLNIYRRRSYQMNIIVFPSLVQGERAVKSLIKALKNVEDHDHKCPEESFDVVVITRGGGSLEDLWAFNDELLARKVFDFKTPILSAIGHQTDYTICDYVADMRVETPSAAAEMLTEKQFYFNSTLESNRNNLFKNINYRLLLFKRAVSEGHPKLLINIIFKNINNLKRRLDNMKVINYPEKVIKIHDYQILLDDLVNRLDVYINKKLESYKNELQISFSLLVVLNPKNVLQRGYCYIIGPNERTIESYSKFKMIDKGENIKINFHDGEGFVKKN